MLESLVFQWVASNNELCYKLVEGILAVGPGPSLKDPEDVGWKSQQLSNDMGGI